MWVGGWIRDMGFRFRGEGGLVWVDGCLGRLKRVEWTNRGRYRGWRIWWAVDSLMWMGGWIRGMDGIWENLIVMARERVRVVLFLCLVGR